MLVKPQLLSSLVSLLNLPRRRSESINSVRSPIELKAQAMFAAWVVFPSDGRALVTIVTWDWFA